MRPFTTLLAAALLSALAPHAVTRAATQAEAQAEARAGSRAEADLQLWEDASPPAGQILRCTPEGVVIDAPVTGQTIIGWARVRDVRGRHAPEAAPFEPVADKLWRATTRLSRGDVPAAEPLFEELFADYIGGQGPTSAAISSGLLRCRVERGAHTLAVAAWLAWLHAAEPAPGPRWFERSGPAEAALPTDASTGLVPDLPPIWLGLPAVRVFGQAPLGVQSFGDTQRDLAALYQHAANLEFGSEQPLPDTAGGDEGVALVRDIVAAQSLRDEERLAGRRALERRLSARPEGWLDAWLRTALGRSLLRDADPDQRQRGIIELLRVRVTHERDAPYLAGLALAEAAVALRDLGRADEAALLRRELLDAFPGHPAATWEPISLWSAAPTARTNSGSDNPRADDRSPHG